MGVRVVSVPLIYFHEVLPEDGCIRKSINPQKSQILRTIPVSVFVSKRKFETNSSSWIKTLYIFLSRTTRIQLLFVFITTIFLVLHLLYTHNLRPTFTSTQPSDLSSFLTAISSKFFTHQNSDIRRPFCF